MSSDISLQWEDFLSQGLNLPHVVKYGTAPSELGKKHFKAFDYW